MAQHYDYADLEGISLANAVIKQTSMQHANLDKAILEGCEMVDTDLTFAFMAEAKASNLKLKNSILQDVDARKIDLSGATIDDLCKLKGIDLEKAILKEVEADRVNFVGANMKGVDATGAQLKESILEGVNMQFSNLENAVMDGAKANGVDMTGSNLTNIKARGTKLQDSILEGVTAHNADLTNSVMEGANLRGVKMHSAILEKVNLQKADLRNAELEKAKLSEAKMDKAKVNDATNLHGADITNVKGDLEHEDISGKKTEMSPEEKVRCDDQVHKAKQVGAVGKFFGNVCKTFGHSTKKTGEFIKQPMSEKWGRIIGAIVGVGLTVALGLTGGLGLVVLAGVVTASAVAGAVAGHYAAKHTGLSTIAGIGGGVVAGGPIGAVLAGGVAIGANQAVKLVVGKSIDELVGNAITKVSEVVSLGSSVGISAEQEKLLNANKHANNSYKAPVLEAAVSENISQTREQNRIQKKFLAQSIPNSLERPVINAKIQVTKPKLQAKEVGKKLNNNLKNKVEVSNNTTSIKQNKGMGKS